MTDIAPPPDGADELDPNSLVISVEPTEDGGATVTFGQPDAPEDEPESNFNDNLAKKLGDAQCKRLAISLIELIEIDDASRQEWLATLAEGIKLLGLTIEKPNATIGVEGISTVRHSGLLEAVLQFQANATAELLPTDGPIKVRNDNQVVSPQPMPPMMGHNGGPSIDPGTPQMPPQVTSDDRSDAVETAANHYLTTTATEYYPDTDKMMWWVGLSGIGFKKVYRCPMRRRPVSEMVAAQDLIVSNDVVDLRNAGRITHRIKMRPAVLKRMQIVGAYRDIDLTPADESDSNAVEEAISAIDGQTDTGMEREEERERIIYECYAEIDPAEYGLNEPGAPAGLPLPYKVTIDKDTQDILEMRRFWEEDQEEPALYLAKQTFVDFPFVRGMGFYGVGLLHILGNTTQALTAGLRITLDGGMLSNFPGGLIAKGATRQQTVNLAAGVGQFHQVDTAGMPISQAVMPFPFKATDPAFVQFLGAVANDMQRLGGTAEMNVGEGRQDAPVGTTVALIEQATKLLNAVHKRMHASQAREFDLIFDLLREDPTPLLQQGRKRVPVDPQTSQLITQGLADYDLVPVADPNTASHLQRVMKAQAVYQMAQAAPQVFRILDLAERLLKEMRITWGPEVLNSPEEYQQAVAAMAQAHQKGSPAQQQDTPADTMMAQARMLDASTKAKALDQQGQQTMIDAHVKSAEIAQKSTDNARSLADQAQDRQANLQIAHMDVMKALVTHDSSQHHAAHQAGLDRLHEAAMTGLGHAHDAAESGKAHMVAGFGAAFQAHHAGLDRDADLHKAHLAADVQKDRAAQQAKAAKVKMSAAKKAPKR